MVTPQITTVYLSRATTPPARTELQTQREGSNLVVTMSPPLFWRRRGGGQIKKKSERITLFEPVHIHLIRFDGFIFRFICIKEQMNYMYVSDKWKWLSHLSAFVMINLETFYPTYFFFFFWILYFDNFDRMHKNVFFNQLLNVLYIN